MAKSSFINKKVVIFFVVIIVLAGIGFAIYHFTKPKVDLEAPYNNYYDLTTNSDFDLVNSYNAKVTSYLNSCLLTETNQETKTEIQFYLNTYKTLNNISTRLKLLNDIVINNIAFTYDYDGKMLEVQQNMTKSYNAVLEKIADCKTYIQKYLADEKVENINNSQLFSYSKNYVSYYFAYFNEYTTFYAYVGEVFKTYTKDSFDVNQTARYAVKSITNWTNSLAQKVTNWQDEYTFDDINKSLNNLVDFEYYYITLSMYKYDTSFDFSIFDSFDFNTVILHLTNNTQTNFVASQQTDELKTKLTSLFVNFFKVTV